MSKEYIEREALLVELQEELDFETNMYTEEQNKWFNIGLRCVIRDVKTLPAADVKPIVHGEWIHKNGEMYCSVCGSEALMDEVYYKSPYCPDCGAKMDGGNE